MQTFMKIVAVAGAMVVFTGPSVLAQQSDNSTRAPKLGKYTAPPKGPRLKFSHSEVELLPGKYQNGQWLAGVEIKLAPGWKTYWRVPGDAGVPAEFVWKNSKNVKSVSVSWPAPKRYEDITGKSIGYKNQVIFPVHIKPVISGQPAELDLRLYYAVCSDICVPAQANIGLKLPARSVTTASLAKIESFVAKVPKADNANIKITKAEVKMIAGKPVLDVTLKGKDISDNADILVEGYQDAYFEAPQKIADVVGGARFRLKIDGESSMTGIKGKELKLTVLSGENRVVANVVAR